MIFPVNYQNWSQRVVFHYGSEPGTEREIALANCLAEEPLKVYSILKNNLHSISYLSKQWNIGISTDSAEKMIMSDIAEKIDEFLKNSRVILLNIKEDKNNNIPSKEVIELPPSLAVIFDSALRANFLVFNIEINLSHNTIDERSLDDYLEAVHLPKEFCTIGHFKICIKPNKISLNEENLREIKENWHIEWPEINEYEKNFLEDGPSEKNLNQKKCSPCSIL